MRVRLLVSCSVLLAALFLMGVHCAWAAPPIGPNEWRIYSKSGLMGDYYGDTLKPSDWQHAINKHNLQIRSIELGRNANIMVFQEMYYGGKSEIFSGSKVSLGKWDNEIGSFIAFFRNQGKPAGVLLRGIKVKGGRQRIYSKFFTHRDIQLKTNNNILYNQDDGAIHYVQNLEIGGQDLMAQKGRKLSVGLKATKNSREIILPHPCMTKDRKARYSVGPYVPAEYVKSMEIRIYNLTSKEDSKRCHIGDYDFQVCEGYDLGGSCGGSKYLRNKDFTYQAFNLSKYRGDNQTSSIGLGSFRAMMIFEHSNLEGRWKILRSSKNLSKAWNNRISSYLVFPRIWGEPPGIHVTAKVSNMGIGRLLDKFYIIDHTPDVYKVRLPKLPSDFDDSIRWIDLSRRDIGFRVCTKENLKGSCLSYPPNGKFSSRDTKQKHFRTEKNGMRVVLNDPYWDNVSSLEYWIKGGEKWPRSCVRTGDDHHMSCTTNRKRPAKKAKKSSAPNKVRKEAPPADRTLQLHGKWKTNSHEFDSTVLVRQKKENIWFSSGNLKGWGSIKDKVVTLQYKTSKGGRLLRGEVVKRTNLNKALAIKWDKAGVWYRQ